MGLTYDLEYWYKDSRTVKQKKTNTVEKHLCFNILEMKMLVPDCYNRIFDYTRKYGKN